MDWTLNHNTIFVTGTDTDAGKTYVSEIILQKVCQQGLRCVGFKPVSAGCEQTPNGLRNDDALRLMASANIEADYEAVNPIAFADPVAPHLAALKQNTPINMEALDEAYSHLNSLQPNLLLVEGAGGWQLPLGHALVRLQQKLVPSEKNLFMPEFVNKHQIPVVLVVGMKLGCLNHALLTYQAIVSSGARCIGWVANQIDPEMDYYIQNINSLKELIEAPLLGHIKHGDKADIAELSIDALFR